MTRTCSALTASGYRHIAAEIQNVSTNPQAWEAYARATFEAHVKALPPGKLRFLQYAGKPTRAWWLSRVNDGAVLL